MGGCESHKIEFGYYMNKPESSKTGETRILRAGTLKQGEPLAERDRRQPDSVTLLEIIE